MRNVRSAQMIGAKFISNYIEEKASISTVIVRFIFNSETSLRQRRGMYRGVKDAWTIFDEYALLLHTPITVLFTSALSFYEKEEGDIW